MDHRRMRIALAAVVIAAGGGVLAESASSREEPNPPLFGTDRNYIEPTTPALAYGNYLGLIRALSADGEIVAVDFVSHTGGVVENVRPEQLVDAGVLVTSGFFAPTPTPFKLRSNETSSWPYRVPTRSSKARLTRQRNSRRRLPPEWTSRVRKGWR